MLELFLYQITFLEKKPLEPEIKLKKNPTKFLILEDKKTIHLIMTKVPGVVYVLQHIAF